MYSISRSKMSNFIGFEYIRGKNIFFLNIFPHFEYMKKFTNETI